MYRQADFFPVEMRIILDLCGGTGAWSKPYADAGYNVHVITNLNLMSGHGWATMK